MGVIVVVVVVVVGAQQDVEPESARIKLAIASLKMKQWLTKVESLKLESLILNQSCKRLSFSWRLQKHIRKSAAQYYFITEVVPVITIINLNH